MSNKLEIPITDEQLPPTPKRPSTVRFTVEEAISIQEALNYYYGGLSETKAVPSLHKMEKRLAKFIEKYSQQPIKLPVEKHLKEVKDEPTNQN